MSQQETQLQIMMPRTLITQRTKSCDNGEESVGGACKKACLHGVGTTVVIVLFVISVAALAALTIIFTGFIDIC